MVLVRVVHRWAQRGHHNAQIDNGNIRCCRLNRSDERHLRRRWSELGSEQRFRLIYRHYLQRLSTNNRITIVVASHSDDVCVFVKLITQIAISEGEYSSCYGQLLPKWRWNEGQTNLVSWSALADLNISVLWNIYITGEKHDY